MGLNTVDHIKRPAAQPVDHRLALFVPDEGITTVAATYYVLRLLPEEADSFDGVDVAMANKRPISKQSVGNGK